MSQLSNSAHRTRRANRAAAMAAAATVFLAAVSPGAASAQQDLRSPDARDAAVAAEAQGYQDLRSADARDAALASQAASYQDLRSPDARDSGRVPVTVAAPSTPTADTGIDWIVAIVAGGVLLLLGVAGVALLGRRRAAVVSP